MIADDGPYRCYFKCGAKLRTKYNREAISGWDWFTGSGSQTIHVCPNCRFNRTQDVLGLMRHRGVPIDPERIPDDPPYPAIDPQ